MSYLQKNIKWRVTASERQNIMSAESLLFKFVFNILHQKSNALVKSVDLVEWVFFIATSVTFESFPSRTSEFIYMSCPKGKDSDSFLL